MTVMVMWDSVEEQIVRWFLPAGFSWSDFDWAVDKSAELINSVDHRVDLLVVTESPFLPDPMGLGHFLRALTYPLAKNNGGRLVIVNAGGTAEVLLKFSQRAYPSESTTFTELRFFATESQARAYLGGKPYPQGYKFRKAG